MVGKREAGGFSAFHAGAVDRWLAVLACAIIGGEKWKGERAGKEREVAADGRGQQHSEREGETARAGG